MGGDPKCNKTKWKLLQHSYLQTVIVAFMFIERGVGAVWSMG